MERNLTDRIETFDEEISGKCVCGRPIKKVINSSISVRRDKVRFYHPNGDRGWSMFRCLCGNVISDTFIAIPDNCTSKEDGICRLPIGTCTQCVGKDFVENVK